MNQRAVVSIVCASQPGLLGAVAQRLFDLGCNLADTTYAALAGAAELTTICELPPALARETLAFELRRLPEVAGGRVSVSAYHRPDDRGSHRITHRFEVSGPDRPGLLVRLAETFTAHGAEVLRLNSHTSVTAGDTTHVIRFAVALSDQTAEDCCAALAAAATALGLECRTEDA
ncbi:MAG: glycine cleavage system protein R [Alphaproteobacteria bacterium]